MWADDHCPMCGGPDTFVFAEARGIPVDVGVLCASRAQALAAPTGSMRLARCRACGYIGNRTLDPALLHHRLGYDASLHHSPRYRAFLERLADDLVARYHLQGKTVLEIACGSGGFFLHLLVERGVARGIGIDPTIVEPGEAAIGSGRITLIRDRYTDRYGDPGADLYCCRQAFHEMTAPRDLLATVRGAAGRRLGSAIYFEVVNAVPVFGRGSVWQLIYEYSSYFSAVALANAFRVSGFRPTAVAPCYDDGQYLAIEAVPADSAERLVPPTEDGIDDASLRAFGTCLEDSVRRWDRRLTEWEAAGKRVLVWGAGGRGIAFLSLVPAARRLRHAVDISPDRQGGYVPRGGQQVVPPEFARSFAPDVVLVTNATYRDEVRGQLAAMGLACDVAAL